MSDREFKASLKRHGWRFVLGWVDLGEGRPSIGCIMTKKRGDWKLDKRATLAKAIRESERHEARP